MCISNASFEVMNIMKPLDFAAASFDLVNARFLFAALPEAIWPSFLSECMRLLRPGGILRLTEPIILGDTTSPAFEDMQLLLFQMLHRRGYGFSVDGSDLGLPTVLPQLLSQSGYSEVHVVPHALDVSAGAAAWADFYHNTEVAYRLGLLSLVQPGVISQEKIELLYRQMLTEMQSEEFSGQWHFTTFWATKQA